MTLREKLAALVEQWRAEVAELRPRVKEQTWCATRLVAINSCADDIAALLAAHEEPVGVSTCPKCGEPATYSTFCNCVCWAKDWQPPEPVVEGWPELTICPGCGRERPDLDPGDLIIQPTGEGGGDDSA